MAETSSSDTIINEITGDLFSGSPSDALVHWSMSDKPSSVSQDLAMGKGIAVAFKQRFSSVNSLKSQQKKVGEVAFLNLTAKQQAAFALAAQISVPAEGFADRYIYYMITKPRYFHKPTMADFTSSLVELRNLAVKDGVSAISMPRIGCGLDKLDWKTVKELISQTFHGTNITINVYSL